MMMWPLYNSYSQKEETKKEKPLSNLNLEPQEMQTKSCSNNYISTSLKTFPKTQDLDLQAKLPLSVTIQPFAERKKEMKNNQDIPVINYGKENFVRCECGGYLNPFVQPNFMSFHYTCPLCGTTSNFPEWWINSNSQSGYQGNNMELNKRVEFSDSVIEFQANSKYQNRQTSDPIYFFLIEISEYTINNNLVALMCKSIKKWIKSKLIDKEASNSQSIKVGIICFHSVVDAILIKKKSKRPEIITLGDLTDYFVPCPTKSCIVKIKTHYKSIYSALQLIPEIYKKKINHQPIKQSKDQQSTSESCLSFALQISFGFLNSVGGKLICLIANRPNLSKGMLRNRENQELVGSKEESTLLNPEKDSIHGQFWKQIAKKFSKYYISVSLFLFPFQYLDIATFAQLTHYTAGELFVYDNLSLQTAHKLRSFQRQLTQLLNREDCWEAIIRTRISYGFSIKQYFTDCLISNDDLLYVPNISPDYSLNIQLQIHSKEIISNYLFIQTVVV
ncbi:sec24-related protein [Anaeramoeba flamelloides]|uniref:Sec24-related protein n=1 Tax=Anaeramoeba flamelloides TaxID=1746091 RepID=A0ABQ8XPA9_9EUKA|nr:sec24-related protein [Anaeramoeba flamelloides]